MTGGIKEARNIIPSLSAWLKRFIMSCTLPTLAPDESSSFSNCGRVREGVRRETRT